MKFLLDTNVVLDWLVFNDPATQLLQESMHAGRAVIGAHPIVLDELQRVLGYPNLKLSQERQAQLLDEYRRRCALLTLAEEFSREQLLLPVGFPCCRDRDDQPFIALAYHTQSILVSKDKAVLKLRKRAARFGVEIVDLIELNKRMAI